MNSWKFLKNVDAFIQKEGLLKQDENLVIGISGGADSVCLLSVLSELKLKYNINMIAVHVNHGIRGTEADKDELFVKELCDTMKILLYSYTVNVRELAELHKISEEEEGRNVRYECFERSAVNAFHGENYKIAVAHNKNDVAETMLFHLFRGSNMTGLGSIRPVNDRIIRPLLNTQRRWIEGYLNEIGQKYCTDYTNFETEYTRNKIRNDILPIVIDKINHQAIEHMATAANSIREADLFLEKYTNRVFENIAVMEFIPYIRIEALKREEELIQKRIIRKMIGCVNGKLKDITSIHIENALDLCSKANGKQINIPYGMLIQRKEDKLYFYTKEDIGVVSFEDSKYDFCVEVEMNQEYYLEKQGICVAFSLKKYEKKQLIPKNNYTKWFDYDKIYNVILLRTRRNGDKIQINKNGGSKKLKDVLIDAKIEREKRDLIPIIAEGNNVIWALNVRNSEKYQVDENTKNVLEVTISTKVSEADNGRKY